jgi:hypothetical protein
VLVCELMDACIFVCMVAKSFICHSCHPIPSVEFSPTNSPEDEEKLFVDSIPLEQLHIIYTSMTKLSLVERLVLLHLLGATDGNVIIVHGHRNIIVCKIADQPSPRCRAMKARRTKIVWSLVIHHWSVSQSLGWMGHTRMLASLHLSISSSCIVLVTTTRFSTNRPEGQLAQWLPHYPGMPIPIPCRRPIATGPVKIAPQVKMGFNPHERFT